MAGPRLLWSLVPKICYRLKSKSGSIMQNSAWCAHRVLGAKPMDIRAV